MIGIETSHNLERFATPISLSELKGEKIAFACRYYNHNSPGKNLTEAEASTLEQAGMQIVSVWENGYPTEAKYFSYEQGIADGRRAMEMAYKFNQPDCSVVYFAVDWDAYKSADKAVVIEYFKGIDAGTQQAYEAYPHHSDQDTPVYSIGVYGSIYVLEWLQAENLAQYFWQAYAHGWSGGKNKQAFEGHLHTIDYNLKVAGVEVEAVQALDSEDFGGWTRPIL